MPSTINAGHIQVKAAKWNESCTTELDLINQQANYPAIRELIEYANPRMLSTLIVAGARDQQSVGYIPSKVGDAITKGKSIGSNMYQFDVQGTIEIASVINHQVGSTQADGSFQLSMADQLLYPGMNCLFNGEEFQARVMGGNTGSAGNWIYNFQSPDGRLFVFATHVANQSGTKTVWGGYTTYSEKSVTGYSRSFGTDTFVQHMTIQRKSFGITGDAASDVLWVHYTNSEGKQAKGWYYRQMAQSRLQMMMEDETAKWDGISSMKNANGTLKNMNQVYIDPITGLPIIQGDGILAQIDNQNVLYGGGPNGDATITDLQDMMTFLETKTTAVTGKVWYVVTGTRGYANLQRLWSSYAITNQNITMFKEGEAKIGGAMVDVGYHFTSYNFNGNQMVAVKHPMWDNINKYTDLGTDGKSNRSNMMVFLDMSTQEGAANIEILSKGANGVNRNKVEASLNGLTGAAGAIISPVDELSYHTLIQNMIVIYNTSSCGIIRR